MNKDQPPAAFARFASSASVSSDATAASSASTHPGETPNPVHRLGIDVATKLGADNEEHVDLCIDIHGDRDALKARQAHKLRRPGEEEARSESLPIMQRSLFPRPRPTITTQALDNSELVTLIDDQGALQSKIQEALATLEAHHQSQTAGHPVVQEGCPVSE